MLVTHYTLASGAPLTTPVNGNDNLLVGINDGELVNETTSPRAHVTMGSGTVVLLPKEKTYRLRNIGDHALEVLLIEIRK